MSTDAIESVIFTNTNFTDAISSFSDYKLDSEHVQKKEQHLFEKKITWQICQCENGTMHYFIIGNYDIAHELCIDDIFKSNIVYELVYDLACLSIVNSDYSPFKCHSRIKVPFEDCLYTVFEAYIGTRIAGSIIPIKKASLFNVTLERYHELINLLRNERLELENHRDCNIFLTNTTDAMVFFLRNLSAFLGHLHAGNQEDVAKVDILLAEMETVGLNKWFSCFENDLIRLFRDFVNTGGMAGLEAISMHFQRLLSIAFFFLGKHNEGYACYPLPMDAFVPLNH